MEPIFGEKKKWRINFKLWNPERDKKFLKRTAIIIVALTVVLFWADVYYAFIEDESTNSVNQSTEEQADQDIFCNTVGINLHGTLVTYIPPKDSDDDSDDASDMTSSDDILNYLEQAEEDKDIKAIVLEVDSYGGSAVAAEEISNALKRVTKPTVAYIRDGGASAAYWAATGADMIFASKNSDVGSIGVVCAPFFGHLFPHKSTFNGKGVKL
ncbi:MAG: S49 family peptidase [bacterium]